MQTISRRIRPALSAGATTRYSDVRICASCLTQIRPAIRARIALSRRRHLSETSQPGDPVGPQNHYELFPDTLGASAIPPDGPFEVDTKLLRREFLRLQAKAHPDRMPHDRKRQAEALSARINEAYKTLSSPLLRAQYLLSLRGLDTDDETAKVDDPDLLMEVLGTRELIEEAERESDLDPVRTSNDARIAQSVAALDAAFKAHDLPRAKAESIRLRYWTNIQDCMDAWEKGKPVVMLH